MIKPNTIRIWFSQGKRGYFTKDTIDCLKCNKDVGIVFIYLLEHKKKVTKAGTYCDKCFREIKKLGIVNEYKIVQIVDILPPDSQPVFDRPPNLASARDISVFEASSQATAPAEKVIDRTRLAGRESLSGAKIGVTPKEAIAHKDDEVKDIDAVLIGMKDGGI